MTIEWREVERKFLATMKICRIATVSAKTIPHVVPFWYVFDGESQDFYLITDYGTKTFRNIKDNENVSLVIDVYSDIEVRAIVVWGIAQIVEFGEEYRHAESLLKGKYPAWYNHPPWGEGKAPIIKLLPTFKKSWGLG